MNGIKRTWKFLDKQKCPVIGCKTNGIKTKLIQKGLGLNLKCPRCGGMWCLNWDASWFEFEKPEQPA